MRILLVEDNEMSRDMLSRRLTKKGHDVILAINGAQGLEKAASDAPDIVLLDIAHRHQDLVGSHDADLGALHLGLLREPQPYGLGCLTENGIARRIGFDQLKVESGVCRMHRSCGSQGSRLDEVATIDAVASVCGPLSDEVEHRYSPPFQPRGFDQIAQSNLAVIVLADGCPGAADIQLHTPRPFVSPTVFNGVDFVALPVGQSTVAVIAAAIRRENTGLLEG